MCAETFKVVRAPPAHARSLEGTLSTGTNGVEDFY